MANKFQTSLGQKGTAKSPSAVDNSEHNDLSWSKKVSDTTPGAIASILNDTSEHAALAGQLVRFTNTTGSIAFIWVGESGTAPGTPDVTNSLALPPNGVMMIVMPCPIDDKKSPAFKCSATTVQAVVFEL